VPTAEYDRLRADALAWLEPYYDRDHLLRTEEWLVELEPGAAEPLRIAALLHDMERAVPGGPKLDKRRDRWDDEEYNRAHCERSAAVVAGWLVGRGATEPFVAGASQIREHEFGGSPDGDLLQAADSLSWLEVNGTLAAAWVERGECDVAKAREKLVWMHDRVRYQPARDIAHVLLQKTLSELGW